MVFKFLWLEKCFRKAFFSGWIGVNNWPNCTILWHCVDKVLESVNNSKPLFHLEFQIAKEMLISPTLNLPDVL